MKLAVLQEGPDLGRLLDWILAHNFFCLASYETINALFFGTNIVVFVENTTVVQIQEWKAEN